MGIQLIKDLAAISKTSVSDLMFTPHSRHNNKWTKFSILSTSPNNLHLNTLPSDTYIPPSDSIVPVRTQTTSTSILVTHLAQVLPPNHTTALPLILHNLFNNLAEWKAQLLQNISLMGPTMLIELLSCNGTILLATNGVPRWMWAWVPSGGS